MSLSIFVFMFTIFLVKLPIISTHPYVAPLLNCERSGRARGYIVALRAGRSIEEHDVYLADTVDLSSRRTIKNLSHGAMYFIDINDGMLASIRADPSVRHVQCNFERSGLEKVI